MRTGNQLIFAMVITAMIMSPVARAGTRVNAMDYSSSNVGSQSNAIGQGGNNFVTGSGTGISTGNAIGSVKNINATSRGDASVGDVGNSLSGSTGQNAMANANATLSAGSKVNSTTTASAYNSSENGGKGITSGGGISSIDVKSGLQKSEGAAGSSLSNRGSYLD